MEHPPDPQPLLKIPAGQKGQILGLIRYEQKRGRPGATVEAVSRLAAKYTGRVSELRQLGFNVVPYRDDETGIRYYREEKTPLVRPTPISDVAYYFGVGPPHEMYLSPPFASSQERDEAALAYYNDVECDLGQFFWMEAKSPAWRVLKGGPLELDTGGTP